LVEICATARFAIFLHFLNFSRMAVRTFDQGDAMKKNLMMGAAFAALTVAPALAADLPARTYTKAPVLEAPASWTGFYLGGNVGGGWNTNFWDNLNSQLQTNFPLGGGNSNGLLGGFQGGFNYQIGPKIVIGIEGEYDFSGIKGDLVFMPRDFVGHIHTRENSIAAVTGKIGGIYHDDILIYVKGGWAWSQFKYDISVTNTGEGTSGGVYPTQTNNRSGGTLGFGTEYKLDRNWSAKIEYDYYDFGTKTVFFPQGISINSFPGLTAPFRVDVMQQTHVIKAGFNYNFGMLR
jgi:outer membrane immunogenic protein